jgi:uncharacterized protein (TIGR02757 family)
MNPEKLYVYNGLSDREMKEFLDEMARRYNRPDFIEKDPVSIPHGYSEKEDIEVAGFLAATISWGNRTMILNSARRMMKIMGNSPYDFIMSHDEDDLELIDGSIHRTFNSEDFKSIIRGLRHVYKNHQGMEYIFNRYQTEGSLQPAIHEFRRIIFEPPHELRAEKHISDPFKGSAAKKINMYLRWMIRKDTNGVDFGIWKSISPSVLSCPLDVHSGNVARKLGLLTRQQSDAKAVAELDASLRELDSNDPVKYDFALFGLGVFEGFK